MAKQKSIKLSFSLGFQVKYCLLMIAIFSGSSLSLYFLMDRALSGSYLENLRTLYFLDQNLSQYLAIMALLQTLFILVLTLVINLLVSHQIAGPVYRYEEVLGEIATGQLPVQVSTRRTDQLKPVVASLNELTSSFRDVFSGAQNLQEQLVAHEGLSPEKQTAHLAELRQEVASLRQTLKDFSETGDLR